jgi:alkyl sulfatase BDS1-like metallo-beta-lactamase superfamily hydrolase
MRRITYGFVCVLSIALTACVAAESTVKKTPMTPKEKLIAHNVQFEKRIMEVAPGVHAAIGYAGSNSTMIVGDDGVIIVDTLPALASAEILSADFRKISGKPVKAIIYTHGHIDHIGGARMMAGGDKPEVYARSNLTLDRVDASPSPNSRKRSMRQFGRKLKPHTERINIGAGPAVQPMKGFGQGALEATKLFDDERLKLTISGVDIELVKAPGETDDQLYVWLPKQKVLFTGDNFYQSFPNLYAIRGTPHRDLLPWVRSLGKMSGEPAEVLVPGHTSPIVGAGAVHQALIDYRDAIKFVHDKTKEGMDKGMTPDELVDYVKLPVHLAERPYLIEYYGRVDTAVRAVFDGYLGWFDGNPTNLSNLSLSAEAKRVAALAGGEDALLAELNEAVAAGDHVWVLRVADYLLALDSHGEAATGAKIAAMTALADETVNAPTRNYYLSVAKELRDAGTEEKTAGH